MNKGLFIIIWLGAIISITATAQEPDRHWLKVWAPGREARSAVADTGATIEYIGGDFVAVIATDEERRFIESHFQVETGFKIVPQMLDFPERDSRYHNYRELVEAIQRLRRAAPHLVRVEEIGRSLEDRPLLSIRISTDPDSSRGQKPGIVMMGGHHAREHLSVELPLMLAQYLVARYDAGVPSIRRLLQGREINIIPVVNPDGKEHDISGSRYKSWRKNRRPNRGGSFGVDLNRNYPFRWGTGGSSNRPTSDTYRGPRPLSEPETQAIARFVSSKDNLSILVSFHTFSELILYPWGHSFDSIPIQRDLLVHKTMAEQMATWNGYRPQQSSDLYIASGDTTDWSYGQLGLISFTFELDPKSPFQGGFYPGAAAIDVVFRKNLKPALYLIEHADNPYRVLQSQSQRFGLEAAPLLGP